MKINNKHRYIYVGSAMGGLRGRLSRHISRSHEKKLHWHVDYLLQNTTITDIIYAETTRKLECIISNQIQQMKTTFSPINDFGNSDCKSCISHLYKASTKENATHHTQIIEQIFNSLHLKSTRLQINNK
ncbi:MAG: GIY-YIG nuclease family protein [Promethearchaeota archaeon]